MFKLIDFDDKIFTSQQFKKDEISFNIILTLIQKREYYPQIKCYSDQKDVIILNTDANHPVVVWTSENFNDFELIYNFVSKVFSKNEPLSLIAKQSCYQFFQKRNWVSDDENTKILGVYKLDKLRDIEHITKHFNDCAEIEKAYLSDVNPATGEVTINLNAPNDLYGKVLKDIIGIDIKNSKLK